MSEQYKENETAGGQSDSTGVGSIDLVRRYELWIMGIDWNGNETEWVKVKCYRKFRMAEQAIKDRIKATHCRFPRRWKIRDSVGNSESLYD